MTNEEINKLKKENKRMRKQLNKLAVLELPAVLEKDKTYEEVYGTIGIKNYVRSIAIYGLGGDINE